MREQISSMEATLDEDSVGSCTDAHHDWDFSNPVEKDDKTKTLRCKNGCGQTISMKRKFLAEAPPCTDGGCHTWAHIPGSTDCRSEWTSERYRCTTSGCPVVKTVQRWHDQDGVYARDIWYDW